MKRVLVTSLVSIVVSSPAWTQPINCPPPPSTSDVRRSIDVGAEANFISRFLSYFGLNYQEESAITQNLSQLPNADALFRELYYLSEKCRAIMATNMPDEYKIREWDNVINQVAGYQPPTPSPYPDPQPIPNNDIARLPPAPSPLSSAEAAGLALEWIEAMFNVRIGIDKAMSMSSFPFCGTMVLHTPADFQRSFADVASGQFGAPADLYVSTVDNVSTYLYVAQQRLSNVPSYDMQSSRVQLEAKEMRIARHCTDQNVMMEDDYVVEVHVSLPSIGREVFFHVIVSARDGSIKGLLV